MKGYFRINMKATSRPWPGGEQERPSRRTGEARLLEVEKALRKDGIPFVEDYDLHGNVIVRYGDGIEEEG